MNDEYADKNIKFYLAPYFFRTLYNNYGDFWFREIRFSVYVSVFNLRVKK